MGYFSVVHENGLMVLMSVRGGLSFLGTVLQLLSYLILGVRPIFWVRITGSFSVFLYLFYVDSLVAGASKTQEDTL